MDELVYEVPFESEYEHTFEPEFQEWTPYFESFVYSINGRYGNVLLYANELPLSPSNPETITAITKDQIDALFT